jgi:hypothetical protein
MAVQKVSCRGRETIAALGCERNQTKNYKRVEFPFACLLKSKTKFTTNVSPNPVRA